MVYFKNWLFCIRCVDLFVLIWLICGSGFGLCVIVEICCVNSVGLVFFRFGILVVD